MRTHTLQVVAIALIVAGYGGGTGENADSTIGPSASETPKAKGPDQTQTSDAGRKMIVTYDDATSPDAINGKRCCRTTRSSKTSPPTSTSH